MKKHRGDRERRRDETPPGQADNLARTIRNSAISIFYQNRDLRYTRMCNPLPGMKSMEILGRTDEELFSPENAGRLKEVKARALNGATVLKEEIELVHDGEEFFFEISAEPVRNGTGETTGIAGVLVDVTERKRVEDSLTKSEELLRRVLETIPDLLSVQDREMRIVFSNWHGGYDYVPHEMRQGHPFCYDAYYPEAGRECEPCHVREVFRTGKPVYAEKFNPRIGHVEAQAYPVFDASGNVVLVIEHIRDITALKRTQERLLKMNEAFLGFGADADENINRLVALCGEQLQAVCALYNRLEGEMLCSVGRWHTPPDFPPMDRAEGHICFDLIRDREEALRVIRDLPATSYAVTDPNVLRYGLKTYIGKPVSFGGVHIGSLCVVYQEDYIPSDEEQRLLGIIAGAIGIEEKRKRAEDEIRRLNAELEARVRERTAQLEAANRELEAFNYSVSHDLHAPLMILDGFSRELRTKYSDRLDETGMEYLEKLQKASRRMAHLIDAILRLSSLSRSEMCRERVDLSRKAQLVAAELRQREPERSVTFRITPEVYAFGDKRLLKVVLENLLGNAWKYTAREEAAIIEFGCQETDGEKVFFVRDNGVGFSMDQAERIFLPFQRLHAEEEFPGYGIGLATVKRIIDRHGGRLWAEGQVGSGATFSFTLP
jgi:PAS domain S-box-containing protein